MGGGGGVGVAVHWVTDPGDGVGRGLDGGDVGGKVGFDFGGTVTSY